MVYTETEIADEYRLLVTENQVAFRLETAPRRLWNRVKRTGLHWWERLLAAHCGLSSAPAHADGFLFTLANEQDCPATVKHWAVILRGFVSELLSDVAGAVEHCSRVVVDPTAAISQRTIARMSRAIAFTAVEDFDAALSTLQQSEKPGPSGFVG